MNPLPLNCNFYLLQFFIEKVDKLRLSLSDCNIHDYKNVYARLLQEGMLPLCHHSGIMRLSPQREYSKFKGCTSQQS